MIISGRITLVGNVAPWKETA